VLERDNLHPLLGVAANVGPCRPANPHRLVGRVRQFLDGVALTDAPARLNQDRTGPGG
jgi:hypothetical protein